MKTAELERSTTSAATLGTSTSMKALVYHGPGKREWEDKPRPNIKNPSDAVVRITTGTICGTDLHILKGDVPSVTDGRILGHEGIGVIEQVGTGVSEFRAGERVIISCITACLKCDFCRKGMYSHCRHGGWILGNTIGDAGRVRANPPRRRKSSQIPGGWRRRSLGDAERHFAHWL